MRHGSSRRWSTPTSSSGSASRAPGTRYWPRSSTATSRVTAIGYHASAEGAVALQPLGSQANPGTLTRVARSVFGGAGRGIRWYQLVGGEGPSSAALDVGAVPGTDVYSPVDGTVIGLTPYVINGKP